MNERPGDQVELHGLIIRLRGQGYVAGDEYCADLRTLRTVLERMGWSEGEVTRALQAISRIKWGTIR